MSDLGNAMTYQEKIDLCIDCENAQLRKLGDLVLVRCSECGCVMNVKAALPNARCPARKF